MDCETFEKIIVERVFQELDDLTSGAAQRHVAHCSRCRTIEANLRATREVACLPPVELPSGFVDSVLALEPTVRKRLPWRERFGRAISIMAGYAMRPELTMGALSLLLIGSSLFVLRTRPTGRELVQITERGIPEAEAVQNSLPPPSPPPDPPRSGPSSTLQHDPPTSGTASPSSQQTLATLLRTIKLQGCAPALPRLEQLRTAEFGTALGHEATFHAALCYQNLGRADAARRLFLELSGGTSVWKMKAQKQLETLTPMVPRQAPAQPPSAPPEPTHGAAPSQLLVE